MAAFEFCVGDTPLNQPQVIRFNWDAIPEVLRKKSVWGVYRASDKSICRVQNNVHLFRANDLSTAMTFDAARAYAHQLNAGLPVEDFGPMLFVTQDVIILDYDGTERPLHPDADKHWDDYTKDERAHYIAADVRQRHYDLLRELPTWTERSISGMGYHAFYIATSPSATTGVWKRDWNIDVKGAPSFIFMTGDVVQPNAGYLSVAGDWYAQAMIKANADKQFVQMPNIPWLPEVQPDEQVWAKLQKSAPHSAQFLLIDQVQGSTSGSSIGDQRFGALKDLIKYSLNREQVARMYLTMPATSHANRSPNRGRSESSITGYRKYLEKEIDRAALALYQADMFLPQADFSQLLANYDLKQGIHTVPAPIVPIEQRHAINVNYPPSKGMMKRFQDMLDDWQRVHPEISQAAAIAITCAIVGRNYYSRSITYDDQIQRLKATPKRDYICLDFLIGAGANHGKSTSITRFEDMLREGGACEDWPNLVAWASNTPEMTRFSQFGTSMVSGAKFNRAIGNLQEGGLILMDEVQGTMRGWVDKDYGGFGGQFNSLITQRHPSGVLAEVKKASEANNTSAVKAPAVSVFATGIPKDMLEAISKSSMIENGTLSRFLLLYLGEESRIRTVEDTGDFNPDDYYAAPQFTPDVGLMNALEFIVQSNTLREVKLCAMSSQLVGKLLELSTSSVEGLSSAFARSTDQVFKLSALISVLDNPSHPTHSTQSLEWAYDYVVSAKLRSELWLAGRAVTYKSSDREFAQPEAVVQHLHAFIKKHANETSPEFIIMHERLAKIWGNNIATEFAITRGLPFSVLRYYRKSFKLNIVNSSKEIDDALNETLRLGMDSGLLHCYVVNELKYYQAL